MTIHPTKAHAEVHPSQREKTVKSKKARSKSIHEAATHAEANTSQKEKNVKTKTKKSHEAVTHAEANPNEGETTVKTTKVHETADTNPHEVTTTMPKSNHATQPVNPNVSNESESATMPTTTVSNDSNATTTAPATTSATSTGLYIKAPPKMTIPAVPDGFIPEKIALYRGTLPRTEELKAMPDVVEEMGRFTDFSEIFGRLAPSRADVDEALSAAYQWSMMRMNLGVWLVYCQSQEALAWTKVRGLIVRLRPAFTVAVQAAPSLGTTYPGLGRLFNARTTIARLGVTAREANVKAEAAGEPAYKGGAGKRRKKAAADAALLAAQEAAKGDGETTPAHPAVTASTAGPSTIASSPTAPAAAPAAPVAAAPAPAAAPASLPAVNVPTAPHA